MGLFYEEVKKNIAEFYKAFGETMDLTVLELTLAGENAALISMDGLASKKNITEGILNPLLSRKIHGKNGDERMEYIKKQVLGSPEQKDLFDFEAAFESVMSGFALLFLEGCKTGLAFGVQGFATRSVSEPENEMSQRGSREGFVESYQTNVALVRRKMKTPDLMFEKMTAGKKSKTGIALCYLKSVVDPGIVEKVKKQIEKSNLETVLGSAYLSPFLGKSGLFNDVGYTERPDTVCGKISEGRVAVIVDGTPNVLIVPYLFVENFQSMDDYLNRSYFASFTRWLKFLCFFLSLFLPGLYVSAVTFHPELIPDELLIKVVLSEAQTPLPVLWEAVILYLMYEILREAGLRVQKPLGLSVSIVGGLVIGDAAVSSGLIGPLTLMVIAISVLSSYATPKLYEASAILRLLFLLLGGFAGLWGVTLAFCAVLIKMCEKNVYKIPFTAPLSPFSFSMMRDVLFRENWKKLSKKKTRIQNMPGSEIK